MRESAKKLLRIALPLSAAYLVLHSEDALGALAQSRPGVVPVGIAALLGGLLVPYVRQWLIVALCFGIGILAVRDSFWINTSIHSFDSIWVARIYKVT